jgi:hypothetical protein
MNSAQGKLVEGCQCSVHQEDKARGGEDMIREKYEERVLR